MKYWVGKGEAYMSAIPEVIKGAFKFSLAGTTLTVAALGVTKVRFPKQGTIGDFVVLDLTGKSYTFNPAAYPDSMTNGITDGVAWGSAMPWYDYLVNIDNTAANVVMASSRNDVMKTLTAHGNCDFSDGLASTSELQTNSVVWAAHAAGIGGQPVVCIGSHTMTYSYGGVGSREWVIGALAASSGFGEFNRSTLFTMPVAQNGAEAGKLFTSTDGATTLTFTAVNEGFYTRPIPGMCKYMAIFSDQSANGADSTGVRWALPLMNNAVSIAIGAGHAVINNVSSAIEVRVPGSNLYGLAFYVNSSASGAVNDDVFTNTNDSIQFDVTYKAF